MSDMASSMRGGRRIPWLVILLTSVALLALAGHFVGDSTCLSLPAEAAQCATGLQSGTATGQAAVCSWHTGMLVAVLPMVVTPILILSRHTQVRPRASFALIALLCQPPIANLTA